MFKLENQPAVNGQELSSLITQISSQHNKISTSNSGETLPQISTHRSFTFKSPKHNKSGKAVLGMDMSMLVNEGQQLENQLSELSESLVHTHVKSKVTTLPITSTSTCVNNMQNGPQAVMQENSQSTQLGAGMMSTFKTSHFLNSQKHHEDTSPYNYSNLT